MSRGRGEPGAARRNARLRGVPGSNTTYLGPETVQEATYRPEEAVARLRATQRYGPWHRGALGDAPARRLAL